jgi:hypothetical protein
MTRLRAALMFLAIPPILFVILLLRPAYAAIAAALEEIEASVVLMHDFAETVIYGAE